MAEKIGNPFKVSLNVKIYQPNILYNKDDIILEPNTKTIGIAKYTFKSSDWTNDADKIKILNKATTQVTNLQSYTFTTTSENETIDITKTTNSTNVIAQVYKLDDTPTNITNDVQTNDSNTNILHTNHPFVTIDSEGLKLKTQVNVTWSYYDSDVNGNDYYITNEIFDTNQLMSLSGA
jgi:hypothetical protein